MLIKHCDLPWTDRLQLDVTLEFADKSDDIEVISDGRFSRPTLVGKLLLNTVNRETQTLSISTVLILST